MLKTELAYPANSMTLFDKIASRPWAVFLDSGPENNRCDRFDIFSCDPVTTLVTTGNTTSILASDGAYTSSKNPFDLVEEYLQVSNTSNDVDVPFTGGAIGYFSYDLGKRLEKLPDTTEDDEHLPQMAIGIYDWAVVVDHQLKRCWMVGNGAYPSTWDNWKQMHDTLINGPTLTPTSFTVTSNVSKDISYADYETSFNKVKRYIVDGDCYQINLAQRFSADCQGSALEAYKRLRKINPAPYSAYLNYPFCQILSASPELFVKTEGTHASTRPIKGTRPKLASDIDNQRMINDLKSNNKDKAENVMIVDLLRNDFSKNCHTVRVPKLFAIESYATVHHMVSTVTGKIDSESSSINLLKGCFPGGSITGAPKIRAMEIIDEIETQRRGIYCGSIGYIGYNGDMQTNISIRTLSYSDGRIHFWAGGGIVLDSTLEGEYQESLDKAQAMFNLLNDM